MPDTDHISWSKRPVFRSRQVLTAEQLNTGLTDEFDRQRLLNRAVHGYGVVLGFGPVVDDKGALKLTEDCLELSAGLAFDRHGRMLYWKGGHLGLDDLFGERPKKAGRYTLLAHYARRPPQIDGCPPFVADRSPWMLDGVGFTLAYGCRDHDGSLPHHPPGSCVDHTRYLCRRTGGRPGEDDESVAVDDDVSWLARPPGEMVPGPAGDWTYDPNTAVAVPLACIDVDGGLRAEPPHICRSRPFAPRNPLLYELALDGDVALPRVKSISWQSWIDKGWQTKVPWEEFARTIRKDGFVVMFTRPIKIATLHEASVFLDAVLPQRDADYFQARRVPTDGLDDATGIAVLDEQGAELDRAYHELCWGLRLKPTGDWLRNEVTGKYSNLFDGARFELTIRGQLVRDRCGRMLDARPASVDGRGQARPGGDYVSVFQIDKKPGRREAAPVDEE